MSQRIEFVFCSVLSIAHILYSLSECSQISKVFFLLEGVFVALSVLTQLIYFGFVVRISSHVPDV